MIRYAAFLRGINISGKNRIPMGELKKKLRNAGFADAETVLNSGNVVFSSVSGDKKEISQRITALIRDAFGCDIPVFVTECSHLMNILEHAPAWWDTDNPGRYHNLVFILTDESPADICRLIGEPSGDMEQTEICDDVIFWSFDLRYYQKCNWWKRTAAKGIAEKLTIRTGKTIRRICRLKEGNHEEMV